MPDWLDEISDWFDDVRDGAERICDRLLRLWTRVVTHKGGQFVGFGNHFGLPHVGTLKISGCRVYSAMPVRFSDTGKIVFANGSYIKETDNCYRVNVAGKLVSLVVIDTFGNIKTSCHGNQSLSTTVSRRW